MRKVFALSAALVLLSSLVATADESQREQTAEDFHFRIFIDADPNAAAELLTGEDFVWHGGGARGFCPPDGPCFGIPPVQAFADAMNAGMSNLGVVHNAVFSYEDLVNVRWTADGIHTGEFLGFPATHCAIHFTGNDLFRLEDGADGRIAELWQETDLLHLFTQLQQTPCTSQTPGNWDFCSETNRCGIGEGDCDTDNECQSGLICLNQDVGADYGFHPHVDVCETP